MKGLGLKNLSDVVGCCSALFEVIIPTYIWNGCVKSQGIYSFCPVTLLKFKPATSRITTTVTCSVKGIGVRERERETVD